MIGKYRDITTSRKGDAMADQSDSTVGRLVRDVVVVALALVALVWIAIIAIDKYASASDVTAVLAVILSPLAAIATAVFGITYTAQSAVAAGNATAAASETVRQSAESTVARATEGALEAREDVRNARQLFEHLVRRLQDGGLSAPGSDSLAFGPSAGGALEVSIGDLNDVQSRLSSAESRLDAVT